MPRLRVTALLLISSLFIVTVPLLIAAFLLPERIASQMIDKGQAELRHSSEVLAAFVGQSFQHYQEALEVCAKADAHRFLFQLNAGSTSSSGNEGATADTQLDLGRHFGPQFLALFLVSNDGLVRVHVDRRGAEIPIPFELREGASFLERLKTEPPLCLGDVREEEGQRYPTLLMGTPVRGEGGQVLGHLVVRVSLEEPCDLIAKSNLGNGSYGFAIDARGMIVAHPDRDRVLRLDFRKVEGARPMWQEMLKGNSGVASYVSSKGIQKVAAYAPVRICGWSVAMSMNDADFYAMSKQVRRWILWPAASCAALATAASLFIAHAFRQKQRALTAQHELQQQLMQTQKVLTLGQLSGGVAHDFNNILGALQMQISVLRSADNLNEEARLILKECDKTIESGSALTTQLLNFSRKHATRKESLALTEMLRDHANLLQRLLGRSISLSWQVEPESLKVVADAGMLLQVILNLVLNGRDAMVSGGTIQIVAKPHMLDAPREGTQIIRYVKIDVRDEGPGIPPEVKARLFEPFFTTKAPGKGTGLGLSTALRIITDHQGWIEVESVFGKGSCFSVFIPEA